MALDEAENLTIKSSALRDMTVNENLRSDSNNHARRVRARKEPDYGQHRNYPRDWYD
jgi:hypothetical protein